MHVNVITYSGFGGSLANRVPSLRTPIPSSPSSESDSTAASRIEDVDCGREEGGAGRALCDELPPTADNEDFPFCRDRDGASGWATPNSFS